MQLSSADGKRVPGLNFGVLEIADQAWSPASQEGTAARAGFLWSRLVPGYARQGCTSELFLSSDLLMLQRANPSPCLRHTESRIRITKEVGNHDGTVWLIQYFSFDQYQHRPSPMCNSAAIKRMLSTVDQCCALYTIPNAFSIIAQRRWDVCTAPVRSAALSCWVPSIVVDDNRSFFSSLVMHESSNVAL